MKLMARGEFLSIMAALAGTTGIIWAARMLTSVGMPSTLATRLSLVAVVIAVALAVGFKLLYRKEKNPREQVTTIIPLVVFTLAGLVGLLASLPKAPTSDPRELVLYYKAQVVALRGNIEARGSATTLDAEFRKRSLQIADKMGAINESQLGTATKIILHQYRGWAFLMGVSSFGKTTPEYITAANRINYATKAVAEFDEALVLMARVERDNRAGAPDAIPIYEWMTGPSEDLNRTHYLKAIALAVIARAGGGTPKAVIAELAEIKHTYLLTFPPENNPDLKWALQGEAGGATYTNGGTDPPR